MPSPTLSPLRMAIMCLILKGPRSGYDLKKEFEATPMGHFSTSAGAIYPALKRMEEAGWITGTVENAESLRPARLLSLTDDGLAVLKSTFRQPIEKEDIVLRLDQLLLRFAFMTPLLGREATINFLEQMIDGLREYIDELKGTTKQLEGEPPEGILALQHGIESFKCTLRWAQTAHATLLHQPRTAP